MTRIEHTNITVPNIDEAILFIQIVAPDFVIRKDEKPIGSYRWAHIGNENYYLALQEAHLDATPSFPRKAYENYGVNHIAIVVTGMDEIEQKLIKAGYKRGMQTPKEKYRKRLYFFDSFGFEWELIEYKTENTSEKYLYE